MPGSHLARHDDITEVQKFQYSNLVLKLILGIVLTEIIILLTLILICYNSHALTQFGIRIYTEVYLTAFEDI